MDTLNLLASGLQSALSLENLAYATIGVVLGTFYLFALGLGITMPPGVLRGIL